MTALRSWPPPRLSELLRVWFSIGLQSFGGGSSTLYLIHQACITRGWLDEAEFARAWALVQISPGINLIKLTAVIGYELRRWPGLCIALAGLLLPSAAITVLMTAGFAAIQEQPVVVAAMRGVIPATIGLSLAMGIQMARGLLDHARREGRGRLVSYWMLLAAAALLYAVGRASPVAVLGLSGVAAVALLGSAQAALRWARERTRP